VEVGEVKMTVAKASELVPGRIIVLDRDVDPHVLLKVGDQVIGQGELVEHDGVLAVEVTEVL
jgi:flagellar motor switch/type III secretory pathway protein FliN